jgi:ribosome-binding ATPase
MKIGYIGLTIPEGKVKYKDEKLLALEKKDNPKKVSPYFAEFIKEEFVHSDVIVVPEDGVLDLLIYDMEKADARIERAENQFEKDLMQKCMDQMENEVALCDVEFSEDEIEIVKTANFYSFKPVLKLSDDDTEDLNNVITKALDKAGLMFFYTSGPKESHAWIVKKDSDIVTCAGKIHSDLARGFIRGDVVAFDEYLQFHNFNECKSKGVAKVVEKNYIVQPNEIIEIRFNV